jgi:hypothetical protein
MAMVVYKVGKRQGPQKLLDVTQAHMGDFPMFCIHAGGTALSNIGNLRARRDSSNSIYHRTLVYVPALSQDVFSRPVPLLI